MLNREVDWMVHRIRDRNTEYLAFAHRTEADIKSGEVVEKQFPVGKEFLREPAWQERYKAAG